MHRASAVAPVLAFVDLPGGQAVHPEPPVAYVFSGQVRHPFGVPGPSEYVPGRHRVHGPPRSENQCAGHASHRVAPTPEALPAAQSTQEDSLRAEYLFGTHATQEGSSSLSLLEPAGQLMQDSAGSPVPPLNLFRGHFEQCSCPRGANFDAGQLSHTAPSLENLFGEQARHALGSVAPGGLSWPGPQRPQPRPFGCAKAPAEQFSPPGL